ncbi:MAG TPA: glutamine--fructose-6-phosphate transaminase (isomerizing) [Planctomycetota bacterium]|nr:glutamine--fructose-6-phosphate transaminase (isomerizing) [Planctomycetota bacterium]
MCGIMGYVGQRNAMEILVDGLHRLEYRGYDSAGVVVQNGHGLRFEKTVGKISALDARLRLRPIEGRSGLGHTRWATHGGVTESNAHPHFSCDGKIAVVHNGIIENHAELRAELAKHRFSSQTDTEVIPHLIEDLYERSGRSLLRATALALRKIRGSVALGVMSADFPGLLIAARMQCPLVVGVGRGEMLLASDISAIQPITQSVLPLEENEIAEMDATGVQVFDFFLKPKSRNPIEARWNSDPAAKGPFPHFMLKEIHEQKETLAQEVVARLEDLDEVRLPHRMKRVTLLGCGSAWNAGLVGQSVLEEYWKLPATVGYSSEMRYGAHPFGPEVMTIAISQSGETADTLAAARLAQKAGSRVLAITNSRGSTLAREADQTLFMRAGTEVGVAATKTYTSQLLTLILLGIHGARKRRTLPPRTYDSLIHEARILPFHVKRLLARSQEIARCARKYSAGYSFMYLGRHLNLATAFEGALKMKEVSYLHAEGYGAGEMKHGPLALVSDRLVCVAVAPRGRVTEKMISNIQEVRARGGRVISICTERDSWPKELSDEVVSIPDCPELFSPVLAIIPLQLLAYSAAVHLGRDVDRPRNLAKSVTVE